MRRRADEIGPGDLLDLEPSIHSTTPPGPFVVLHSAPNSWARDWWRVTFVGGYWVGSSRRHTFEVIS